MSDADRPAASYKTPLIVGAVMIIGGWALYFYAMGGMSGGGKALGGVLPGLLAVGGLGIFVIGVGTIFVAVVLRWIAKRRAGRS